MLRVLRISLTPSVTSDRRGYCNRSGGPISGFWRSVSSPRNMKFFGVIVLLAVAASCQAETNVRSKRSTINENLLSMLEGLRDTMKTMDPCLDPYTNNEVAFAIDEDLATLVGSFTNLNVTGLSDYEVDKITFSLIGVVFNFAFTFNQISLTTGYTVDGTVANVIPMFGTGDLSVKAGEVSASGTVALSVSNGYLYIRSMTSALSIGSFKAEGTGLMNDDELSALVSAVVTDMVPQLLVDYQDAITGLINTVITSIANRYLGTMTLAELLALIRG